ncbi:MAG: hypothetical protein BGN91_11920 [Nitrobacter sp. 62-13]|nr:MAG: hypothetical protein BGN91_11920 [Nitrobacter sp. 62-13]
MALHSIAFSGDVDTASRPEKSVRTKAVALTPIKARMAQGGREGIRFYVISAKSAGSAVHKVGYGAESRRDTIPLFR